MDLSISKLFIFFQSDGRFKWLDGWPLYYTDWANNEPSLRSGEECVLIKTNGRWDNVPCSELHYPICKETFGEFIKIPLS